MNTADLKRMHDLYKRLNFNVGGGVNVGFTVPPQKQITEESSVIGASNVLDLIRDGLRWRAMEVEHVEKGAKGILLGKDANLNDVTALARDADSLLAAL